MSALHTTIKPTFRTRMKHLELDYHCVREKVALGTLETRYVSTEGQLADLFTKPLSSKRLLFLLQHLTLQQHPSLWLSGDVEISCLQHLLEKDNRCVPDKTTSTSSSTGGNKEGNEPGNNHSQDLVITKESNQLLMG